MNGPLPLVLGFGTHPPSNGAHMLAWWLNAGGEDRTARFCQSAGVRAVWLEDVLLGRVDPYGEMRDTIAGLTGGVVPGEEWDRGCMLGWADKPYGWAAPGQAADRLQGSG